MATKTQNSKLRTQNSLLIGLDSRDPQNTRVFVFNGKKWSINKIILKKETAGSQLLTFLKSSLRGSAKQSLFKLVVINGIGARFSSLRLGVIMANALFLAKDILLYGATLPANEFDIDKIESALLNALKTKPKVQKPLYATIPNITIRAS